MRSLLELVETQTERIVETAIAKLRLAAPDRTVVELADGIQPFLRDFAGALRIAYGEDGTATLPGHSVEAGRHGRQRFRHGFDVLVVVRDYGALCDSITDTAMECRYEMTTREAQVLKQCVDAATSASVDEYWRASHATRQRQADDTLHALVDQIRAEVGTGRMAYRALQSGMIGFTSQTARLVERSFRRIEHALAKTVAASVRANDSRPPERIEIETWLREVLAGVARLDGQRLDVEIEPGLEVDGDSNLLAAAVAHLVQNAITYSHAQATITVSAYTARDTFVNVDVRDECGGLPVNMDVDRFLPYFIEGGERDAPALGLALVQRAAVVHDGEVTVHNRPGAGCTFRLRISRRRDASLT
jgi:signal transduction histidine kinase